MNYNGLKKRETYDELVDFISNDPVIIHYPDRRATQLRESPYLTQLDGEGMRQMETFEFNQLKQKHTQTTNKAIAQAPGQSVAVVAARQPRAPHGFNTSDMFQDDPMPTSEAEDELDDFQHPQAPGPNLGPTLTPDVAQDNDMFEDAECEPAYDLEATAMAHAKERHELEEQLHTTRMNATRQEAASALELQNSLKQRDIERADLLAVMQMEAAHFRQEQLRNEATAKANEKALAAARAEASTAIGANKEEHARKMEALRIQKLEIEHQEQNNKQDLEAHRREVTERAAFLQQHAYMMDNDFRFLQSEKDRVAQEMSNIEEAKRFLMTERFMQEQRAGYHGPSLGMQSSGAMGRPFEIPIQYSPERPKRQSLALPDAQSSGLMGSHSAAAMGSQSSGSAAAGARPSNFIGHTVQQWLSSSIRRDDVIDQLIVRGAILPPGINIKPRQPGYVSKPDLVAIMLARNDYEVY